MKLAALIFGILLLAQIPTSLKSDGKEIEYKRGIVHSGSLYLQGPSESDNGGRFLRINLDNPTRVERIKFRVFESERLSSLMKISGKDIYLSSILDSGGGQIAGQIDRCTLDDLVVTGNGLLAPSVDKLPSYTVSPLLAVPRALRFRAAQFDSFAERIFIRPEVPCHRFVDDHRARRVIAVLRREIAPAA